MKSTFKRALLAFAAVAVIGFGFTGCQNETETEIETQIVNVYQYVLPYDGTTLAGAWEDNYSEYNSYTDFDFKVEANVIYTACYGKQEGTIFQRKLTSSSGFFYYKISDSSSFAYSSKGADSYKNKWYGVYYSISNGAAVICDACPKTYTVDYECFDTLEEAVKGLTISKYFGSKTPFTKVN